MNFSKEKKSKEKKRNVENKTKNENKKKRILWVLACGSVILLCPTFTHALENEALEAVLEPNKPTSLFSKGGRKAKTAFLVVTKLKTCVDPTATPIQKAIACSKVACCGGYAAGSVVSTIATLNPHVKILTSACCSVSWAMLTGLEMIESKAK